MKFSGGIVFLLLAQGLAACSSLPGSPAAPSPPQAQAPIGPQPIVLTISPNIGSIDGDAGMEITGTGFLPTVVVMFDGVRVAGTFDSRDKNFTTMYLRTPPHAAGTVDLVVMNPGGYSQTLSKSFTYASPAGFDFNGSWEAYSYDGSDRSLRFTIENNLFVSVTCVSSTGEVTTIAPSPRPAVNNGAFSFTGDDGIRIAGKIVSASEAVGTINVAACTDMTWRTYLR